MTLMSVLASYAAISHISQCECRGFTEIKNRSKWCNACRNYFTSYWLKFKADIQSHVNSNHISHCIGIKSVKDAVYYVETLFENFVTSLQFSSYWCFRCDRILVDHPHWCRKCDMVQEYMKRRDLEYECELPEHIANSYITTKTRLYLSSL